MNKTQVTTCKEVGCKHKAVRSIAMGKIEWCHNHHVHTYNLMEYPSICIYGDCEKYPAYYNIYNPILRMCDIHKTYTYKYIYQCKILQCNNPIGKIPHKYNYKLCIHHYSVLLDTNIQLNKVSTEKRYISKKEEVQNVLAEEISGCEVQSVLTEEVQNILVEEVQSVLAEEIQSVLTEEVQSVLAEEVQSVLTEEVQSVLAEEVQSVLAEEVQSVLAEEVQSVLVEEVQSVLAEEVLGDEVQGGEISSISEGKKSSELVDNRINMNVSHISINDINMNNQISYVYNLLYGTDLYDPKVNIKCIYSKCNQDGTIQNNNLNDMVCSIHYKEIINNYYKINIDNAIKCRYDLCIYPAIYANIGENISVCHVHKSYNMIGIKDMCDVDKCYMNVHIDKFCINHILHKYIICEINKCNKKAIFGYKNKKSIKCELHAANNMTGPRICALKSCNTRFNHNKIHVNYIYCKQHKLYDKQHNFKSLILYNNKVIKNTVEKKRKIDTCTYDDNYVSYKKQKIYKYRQKNI
uniref:Uncharacterized protein n=1 Tax=Pithovirus LCPAC102 TaxID=2506587 RepID=A0A481Z316_9VIRU|nr:MAG: hypothetical protein LCPAC102_00460 [Pithovirus LCPAC102]